MHEETEPGSPPTDVRVALERHVRSVHEFFGDAEPNPAELDAALARALATTRDSDELRELIRAGRLSEVTGVRPLNLELDIVNKCNFRCVMCMMSHPAQQEQQLQRMPLERFEKLADEVFWHVHALSLTYGAEPLLHPEFARFLAIAQRYRIPRVHAVTNGSLLTEEIAHALVEHETHSIVVSLDAANPVTYQRIRLGGNWSTLIENLERLQRIKRQLGRVKPLLELAFVMMRSNIMELPAFVELGKQLGVDAIYAIHMVPFAPLQIDQETCANIKETTNSMLRTARATAVRLGVNFTSPPEFGIPPAGGATGEGTRRFGLPVSTATSQAGLCPFPWHFAAIDMRGDVIPCGWWQGGAPMGNIYRESFASIWRNPAYERLRAQHRTRSLSPVCLRCPAAGVGSTDDPAAFVAR